MFASHMPQIEKRMPYSELAYLKTPRYKFSESVNRKSAKKSDDPVNWISAVIRSKKRGNSALRHTDPEIERIHQKA